MVTAGDPPAWPGCAEWKQVYRKWNLAAPRSSPPICCFKNVQFPLFLSEPRSACERRRESGYKVGLRGEGHRGAGQGAPREVPAGQGARSPVPPVAPAAPSLLTAPGTGRCGVDPIPGSLSAGDPLVYGKAVICRFSGRPGPEAISVLKGKEKEIAEDDCLGTPEDKERSHFVVFLKSNQARSPGGKVREGSACGGAPWLREAPLPAGPGSACDLGISRVTL